MVLVAYTSTKNALAIAPIIKDEARRGGVDPLLVSAIIQKESTFKNKACLRGAHGLMQVQVHSRSCSKGARQKVLHLYDPIKNIRIGIRLMKWAKFYCKKKKHKKHHWLLHYNQGANVTTRGKVGGYPRRVLRIYERMKRAKMFYEADAL
jgi:soluble lytic murein transglycosylase-like protein